MEQPFWQQKTWRLGALGFMFDALDVALLSFIMAALTIEWSLSPGEKALLGSINGFGMALGALLAGYGADRWGRRRIFLWTLLLFTLGTALSALAWSFTVMLLFRWVIGLGLGGELPIAATYISETVRPEERGRAVVMAESFWALGWLLAALIAYGVMPMFPEYGWRIALLLGGLPAVFALYVRRQLPESRAFLRAIPQQKRVSTIELLRKPFMRHTVVLWVLWFTINFAYYGMFLWLPSLMLARGFTLIQSFGYVLLMTLAQLPGYMTAAWLIERLGRRNVLMIFLLGTAVSAYAFGQATHLWMLIAAGFFLNYFNLGAWGALYAYTPELYPPRLAGRGAGTAAFVGRIGAIIAPLWTGWILSIGWTQAALFWTFVMVLFLGIFVLMWFGLESKGRLPLTWSSES